jgi:branched-subunit amino acid ABC-type transport system permease component
MNGERDLPPPRRRVRVTVVAWLVGIAVAGIGLALGANMSPGSPYRLGSIVIVALVALTVGLVYRRRRS